MQRMIEDIKNIELNVQSEIILNSTFLILHFPLNIKS
jgi:hypothetical protein